MFINDARSVSNILRMDCSVHALKDVLSSRNYN